MKNKILLLLAMGLIAKNKTVAQLYISPGVECSIQGNLPVVLQDMDFVNNGSFTHTGGSFRFAGLNNSSISGVGTVSFYRLEISKNNNTLLLLQREIGIKKEINFMTGLIELNNFNIALDPTAVLINEKEESRITGINGGEIIISLPLNKPSSVNPGNLGAVITSGKDLGLVTIKRGHKALLDGSGTTHSIQRYFDISPTNNSSLKATLRFRYFDAELHGLNENELTLWEQRSNNWTNHGYTTRSAAENFVEKKSINGFSIWTLAVPGNTPSLITQTLSRPDNEVELKTFQLRLFPNPADKFLNIEWSAKSSASTSINIIDVQGRVIKKIQAGAIQKDAINRKTISLVGLAKGVYILELRTGTDVQVTKFVIQ